ncbi:MAG: XdhC/CoxI family protein [Desulfurococcaceae archaeon]
MSSVEILEWVLKRVSKGEKVALVTIVGKEGSGPRDIGTMMAVSADGSAMGTIGGGEVENIVVKEAVSALREGRSKRVKVALRPENVPENAIKTRMICGGILEAFINVIQPTPRVIIVGAGHVGKPVADIGNLLKYHVIVLDRDSELASHERYPYAERIVGDVVSEVEKLELREADVVVVTYGEPEVDYQVLKKLLLKGFKGHVWALCSKRRAIWMIERLKQEGINVDEFKDRIHAPAGLDIGSDTPEEIAVSIWAEILCEARKCSKPVRSLGVLHGPA